MSLSSCKAWADQHGLRLRCTVRREGPRAYRWEIHRGPFIMLSGDVVKSEAHAWDAMWRAIERHGDEWVASARQARTAERAGSAHAAPAAHLSGEQLLEAVMGALEAAAGWSEGTPVRPVEALRGLQLGSIRMWDALNALEAADRIHINAAGEPLVRIPRAATPAGQQLTLEEVA